MLPKDNSCLQHCQWCGAFSPSSEEHGADESNDHHYWSLDQDTVGARSASAAWTAAWWWWADCCNEWLSSNVSKSVVGPVSCSLSSVGWDAWVSGSNVSSDTLESPCSHGAALRNWSVSLVAVCWGCAWWLGSNGGSSGGLDCAWEVECGAADIEESVVDLSWDTDSSSSIEEGSSVSDGLSAAVAILGACLSGASNASGIDLCSWGCVESWDDGNGSLEASFSLDGEEVSWNWGSCECEDCDVLEHWLIWVVSLFIWNRL